MFSKNFLIATLFAGAALAAPTVAQETALETRADWQANKCDANIRITGGRIVSNVRWFVDIIDKEGKNMGHWEATKPATQVVSTTKGSDFTIWWSPSVRSKDSPAKNGIELTYGTQKWNGQDCYKYSQNRGSDWNTEWYCQFDC